MWSDLRELIMLRVESIFLLWFTCQMYLLNELPGAYARHWAKNYGEPGIQRAGKIKSPNKQWLCLKCMLIFLYFDVYVDMGLWDDTRENQGTNHIKRCLVLVCDTHWFPCTQNSMFLTVLTFKMKTQYIGNEIHKQCKVVYLFP